MIRVNLLPVKRKKKPKPVPVFIVVTIALVLLASIGVIYAYYNVKEEIKDLNARKAANDKRIAELKKRLKELENYESLVKSVEKKKKVIIQLRKNQAVPVRLLDVLSRHLPPGTWLKELKFRGSSLDLDGYAFTNSDVVKYVNNLKGSRFFNSVHLAESKRENLKGLKEEVSVYKFTIKADLRG